MLPGGGGMNENSHIWARWRTVAMVTAISHDNHKPLFWPSKWVTYWYVYFSQSCESFLMKFYQRRDLKDVSKLLWLLSTRKICCRYYVRCRPFWKTTKTSARVFAFLPHYSFSCHWICNRDYTVIVILNIRKLTGGKSYIFWQQVRNKVRMQIVKFCKLSHFYT